MRVLVAGGTGQVGRFIVEDLRSAGHAVTLLGRGPIRGLSFHPWGLAEREVVVPEADALVHCAFDHVPGAYRGGEGDDPARFMALNHEGSAALFAAARAAGIGRWVLLSSRSVYGDHRRGEILRETDTPAPDSLYGEMKLAVEREMHRIAAGAATACALRATGVYGLATGAQGHKWQGLFADYLDGRPVPPRIGTEVHGADLAAAVRLVLEMEAGLVPPVCNVSDILLDRNDLLARVRRRTGAALPLPDPFEGTPPGIMATERLRGLGWIPGGFARLDAFLAELFR